MSKKCTPLWCQAHVQVKNVKTFHVRSTFGSWDVEKVHAVVARSTCWSQNVQSTPGPDHFLEVAMSKKCRPLWREAHFEVKMLKARYVRTTFGRSDVVSRGRRKGLCILSKVSKTWGFCSISKNDGRRGTFEEYLQRCIIPGRRSTRDIFIRAVRRSGRWFPERGCILEHQIFILGRWFCVTGAALLVWPSITFSWHAQYFRQVGWKNRKTHWYEAVSSALNFPFLKEVSQSCFVFDVVNFENWGSLAELFRFWCCQVQKLRTSRRIVSFLTLSSSKIEDVSQNCYVFQVDRQTGRQTDR